MAEALGQVGSSAFTRALMNAVDVYGWVKPYAGTLAHINRMLPDVGPSVEVRFEVLKAALRVALEELFEGNLDGDMGEALKALSDPGGNFDELVFALGVAVSQGTPRPKVMDASQRADHFVSLVYEAKIAREHSLGHGGGDDIQQTTGDEAPQPHVEHSPDPESSDADVTLVLAQARASIARLEGALEKTKRVLPKRSAEKKCIECGHPILKCKCAELESKRQKPSVRKQQFKREDKPKKVEGGDSCVESQEAKNGEAPEDTSSDAEDEVTSGNHRKMKLQFQDDDHFPRPVLQAPELWGKWLKKGATERELQDALLEEYVNKVEGKAHPVLRDNHLAMVRSIMASVKAGGTYAKAVALLIVRLEEGMVWLVCQDPHVMQEYRSRVEASQMSGPFKAGWAVVQRRMRQVQATKLKTSEARPHNGRRRPGTYIDPRTWATMTDDQKRATYAGRKGK